MVVEARIRIRHRGCFSERLVGASQCVHLAADRETDLFALNGPDAHVLEAMLRHPRIISRTSTSLVARVEGAAHEVSARIAAAGCTIIWPAVFAGGEETYSLLAPSRDILDRLADALTAYGPVTLEHIGIPPPGALRVNVPMSEITTNLTERQLIVLQTAIAEGYYDSPRRTSTEALAITFGVTRSTLEEHLRKAERRVLEGFAGMLKAQPVLAHTAARRPGRSPAVTPRALHAGLAP